MKTVTLDIETTGLPAKGHTYDKDFMSYPYIVSFAYKIDEQPTQHFIINQDGRLIPDEAIAIHGITNEMAQASDNHLFGVLNCFLTESNGADFIIGHNIYFDISTIKANVLRMMEHKVTFEPFYQAIEELLHKDRRVDTMMKTIKFCNLGGKWPKLTELYAVLFPNEAFNAHSAKDDVDACHKCYLKLKELGVL